MSPRDRTVVEASERGGEAGDTVRVRSRGTIFATVSIALLMASIDSTIVSTGLKTIDHSLHASVAWGAWTISGYLLGTMVAQPVTGRISDLFGRKRVFVICVAIFTLSSLMCGLATSIYILVPLRMLQSLGGGGFLPSASGIVSEVFQADRDRAIGMFNSIFPIGAMIGPILGGIIITYWSWREIFLINVPLGVVLFVLAIRFLPHTAPRSGARPDVRGIILLTTFTSGLMVAITLLGTGSAPFGSEVISAPIVVATVAFVFAFVLFIRHLRRSSAPIIPLFILRNRKFAAMNLINLIYGGSVIGMGAMIPIYAQDRYHMHSLQSGTLLTARSVGSVLLAGASAFALRRIGYRLPMAVGYAIAVVGLLLIASGPPGVSPYTWLAIGAGLTGLGNGMAAPAANNAALALAPNDVASIMGVRGSIRQLGAIVTISVTTALVTRNPLHTGAEFSHCFIAQAILILAVSPLIFTIPERRADW